MKNQVIRTVFVLFVTIRGSKKNLQWFYERINDRLMSHYMEIDVEKIKLSVWCPACFLPFRLHFCRKCVTFAVRLKQNADVHAINNTYQ